MKKFIYFVFIFLSLFTFASIDSKAYFTNAVEISYAEGELYYSTDLENVYILKFWSPVTSQYIPLTSFYSYMDNVNAVDHFYTVPPGYQLYYDNVLQDFPIYSIYFEYDLAGASTSYIKTYNATNELQLSIELSDASLIKILKYTSKTPDAYDTGYRNGRIDGYNSGLTDGYDNGYEDGLTDGYDNGYPDGYDDGLLVSYDTGFQDAFWDIYENGLEGFSFAPTVLNENSFIWGNGYSVGYAEGSAFDALAWLKSLFYLFTWILTVQIVPGLSILTVAGAFFGFIVLILVFKILFGGGK